MTKVKVNVILFTSWDTQETSITYLIQPYWHNWCQVMTWIQVLTYCRQKETASCVCVEVSLSIQILKHQNACGEAEVAQL